MSIFLAAGRATLSKLKQNYGPYAIFYRKRQSLRKELFVMKPYERQRVEDRLAPDE